MLLSKFDVDQEVDLDTAIYGTNTNASYHVIQDFYANTPVIDMALGVSWGKFFCKNNLL